MRVVIADDEMLMREGTARLLEDAGVEVVAAVDDASKLLREVATQRPDVAIVDIKMPPTHTDEGLAAAEEIGDPSPRSPCWCSLSTWNRCTRCGCSRVIRKAAGTS